MAQDERDCVVYEHPRQDEYAGYSSEPPAEPKVVFTGTQAECDGYIKREYENHDLGNPGMFDAPRPNLEVRRTRPAYRDTDPV